MTRLDTADFVKETLNTIRAKRYVISHIALFIVLIIVTGIIYYPAKNGPLILDDHSSIHGNTEIKVFPGGTKTFVDAAYSMNNLLHSDSLIPKRPISYVSFALNFYFADDIVSAFKLTNIILHIIAGIFVFLLSTKILTLAKLNLPKPYLTGLAFLITFVWLSHPLFVSTVLYVTQRMTILSALFTFLAVYSFILYRQEFQEKDCGLMRPAMVLGICTMVAYFSKETGALIPFLCLIVEVVFFRFSFHKTTTQLKKTVYIALLVIPSVFILSYLAHAYYYHFDPVTRYFTTYERLLTELRVLWQYISFLLLIDPQGIHFWHDDIQLSKSLFDPITTFSSLVAWLFVLAMTIYCLVKNKLPLLTFCCLWFLVGHLLESTTLNLEIAFEHRNYAPGYGIILLGLITVFSLLRLLLGSSPLALCIASMIALITPVIATDYARAWRDARALALENYSRAPNSPRAIAHMIPFEEDKKESARLKKKIRELLPLEPAHSLSDIASLCQQSIEVPTAMIDQALEKLKVGVPTIATSVTFRSVISECDKAEYDQVLLPVYKAVSASRYSVLAANGILMMAHVQRRMGNETGYWELFERAKSTAMTFDIKDELQKNSTRVNESE
ncbi:MAG: hypothetical protein MI867_26645 [Pseudomonadales bacterium]|nr:hypothetical protein [Pseudomonadales bacterium]